MFCSSCGEKCSDDSNFCPSCGAERKVKIDVEDSTAPTLAQGPVADTKTAFYAGYMVFGLLVIGGWWALAGQVDENAWLLHTIFGGWILFAIFGFTRKWSALVSFGGGFVGGLGIIAAGMTLTEEHQSASGPASNPSAVVAGSNVSAPEPKTVQSPRHFNFSAGTGEWFSELALSVMAGDSDRRYLVIRGDLRNTSPSEVFVKIVCTATVSVKFVNGKSVDISSEDICGDAGGAALTFMTGDSSTADMTRLKLKPGESHKIDTSTGGQLTAAMVSPLLNEMYASYPVSTARMKIELVAETAFGDRVRETLLQTNIPAPSHKARFTLM